MIFNKKC